jgi:hypothetical protein
MTPPIFVVDSGDVLIFESVEKAERYLEPIDFKQGGCPIYDSEGCLIQAIITKNKYVERIHLKAVDSEPPHLNELRESLIEFLKQVTKEGDVLNCITLNEAVKKSLQFKIE